MEKAQVLMEALPFIKEYFGSTVVIKFGGKAMVDEELKASFASDVVLLRYVGINPVIVHGGGPQITEHMDRLALDVEFVDGQRVTDAAAMEVVKMVLVGKVNKEIVSLINGHGDLSVGLSGEDGRMLTTRKKLRDGVDLGFVGEVEAVNPRVLFNLTRDGFVPVVASVGSDGRGRSYNVNADHVAGALAVALKASKLIYLTDVDGIYRDLSDPTSLISEMDGAEARALVESGTLSSGMIPKLSSCVEALEAGVERAYIINGTVKHALLLEVYTPEGIGTMLTR